MAKKITVYPDGTRTEETLGAPVVRKVSAPTVTFTVFEPPSGTPIGKHIHADGSKTSHRFPSQMKAAQRTMNLTELAAAMRAGFFLTSGVFDVPEALVVPARMPDPDGALWPIRHRGKTEMAHPVSPGLLVIDNDFAKKKGETFSLLLSVQSELANCARLEKASSGSNIFAPNGTSLRAMQGEHTLFAQANAADTEHNINVLHARLMIAGKDACNVTKSGRFNERTAVDRQLRHPWQPIFLAATLDEGMRQDLDVEVTPGEMLGRLPALTKEEEQAYQTARAARHDELIPVMESARDAWIEERVKDGWSRSTATKALVSGELEADAKIVLADRTVVTVADILSAPERYNNAICLDPLEPEYRGFAEVGIIYMDGPRPMIYSQAHGGMKFWLPRVSAADDFGAADPDFPQDTGPAGTAAAELPPIERWGADPDALRWASVTIEEVGAEFDLANCALAENVAVAGGLALADGRLVRLTNFAPAVAAVEAAVASGVVGAVAKVMVERIVPALGSRVTETFAAEHFRKLSQLGSTKVEVKEAVIELCDKHAARVEKFAKKLKPHAPAAGYGGGEEDPAEIARRRRAERIAREAAEVERKNEWLASFAHIATDPFGQLRKALASAGLAGDVSGGEVAYMTIVSSAFPSGVARIHSSLRGATGIGKSEALSAALKLSPPEAYHLTNGGSAKSLYYKRADDDVEGEEGTFFRNRCLVLPEADALLHDANEGDAFQCSVKTLLSEERLAMEITVPGAPGELPTVKTVRQGGPTNLLTTSTHSFEAQMENRVMGFELNQSAENEKIVKRAIAERYEGDATDQFDVEPWHNYGLWLREETPAIVLPFSSALAELHSPAHGFRNFHLLHAVASTAALMNKANRERDDKGRIIATLEDYGIAYRLLAGPSDSKIGAVIPPNDIAVFRKIKAHIDENGVVPTFTKDPKRLTISQRNLAKVVGLSQPTVSRVVSFLESHGLLEVDRPISRRKAFDIWVPEEAEELLEGDKDQRLPTPEEVANLMHLMKSF